MTTRIRETAQGCRLPTIRVKAVAVSIVDRSKRYISFFYMIPKKKSPVMRNTSGAGFLIMQVFAGPGFTKTWYYADF
jgi:hypothetical protein